jgi:PKD repeat protein
MLVNDSTNQFLLGASGRSGYGKLVAIVDGCINNDNLVQADNKIFGYNIIDWLVNNTPPVVIVNVSKTIVQIGEIIIFDASASYDPDGEITDYYWNLGDGSFAYQYIIVHCYNTFGTYNVTLTIVDNDGAITTWHTKIIVNSIPIVILNCEVEVVNTLEQVTFISNSYDLDGYIAQVYWEFGDGDCAEGNNRTTHTYVDDGIYNVTLTVTDDLGFSNSTSIKITVNNQYPIANAKGDNILVNNKRRALINNMLTVYEDDLIQFDGTQSYDPDGNAYLDDDPTTDWYEDLNFKWDFHDGTFAYTVTPLHSYYKTNVYEVILTVTDLDNASSYDYIKVEVKNQVPIAEACYDRIVGRTVYFNGSGTKDTKSDLRNLTYNWQFGDGSSSGEQSPIHKYQKDGIYKVKLIVIDDDGEKSLAELIITIGEPEIKLEFIVAGITMMIIIVIALVVYVVLREKRKKRKYKGANTR